MAKLVWDSIGSRLYEAGVDRGVLYLEGQAGVPWNGLTSVNESSSGGDAKPYYMDGVKYLNLSAPEEYEATLSAFTYPDEFSLCQGNVQPRSGLFFTRQRKKTFGLSYRTMIGNDLTPQHGYKIHLIYNALAAPSERSNSTLNESIEAEDFSWKITARPPAMDGYKRTAHIMIDTRFTDPQVLELIENALYGTDEEVARLPTVSELVDIYDTISTLTIVDNGDGTWTATAPYDVIRMMDNDVFEITSPTATYIDEDTYTISSE